jgi:hypothetical protein
MLDNR